MRKSVLLFFVSLFLVSVSLNAQLDDKPKKEAAKKESCVEKKDSVDSKSCCKKELKECEPTKEAKDSASVK